MLIPTQQLERAMRMFRIPDRHGVVVPFRLNDAQRRYIRERTNFDVIYKSRQFGFSSFLELEGAIICARFPQQHAVVIAHDAKSTEKLFRRTQFFLDDTKRLGIQIPFKNYSKNEITFTDTDSTFYIGTAGSRKFGRGDTINFLHCSEVAFWPSAAETMSGLVPAAKYGRIVLESTANGKGNYFHRTCVTALKDMTEEYIDRDSFAKVIRKPKLHFYPWHNFGEYMIPGNYDIADVTEEELDLMQKFHLTLPQIAWRRQTMVELPQELFFPQEYPITFDEGFLASGGNWFHNVSLTPHPFVKKGPVVRYKEPQPGRRYVAGIDTGGGTRRDFSVVEVLDAESLEQVAEYAANDIPPKRFAREAVTLCRDYKALTVIEVQHGLIVLDTFKEDYPSHLIYKREKTDKMKYEEKQQLYGFWTSDTTKRRICSKGREAIDEGAVIHSEFLKDQLDSFIEDVNGHLHGEEGCHDDAPIAYCLAVEGLSQMNLPIHRSTLKKDDPATDVFAGFTWDALRKAYLDRKRKLFHL